MVHGSDLQFCLLKNAVRHHAAVPDTDTETIIYAAGRGHEEVLLALRQFHMVRHEIIERDGILFTPDLTDIAPGISKIVEIKSTRKTGSRFNTADSEPNPFLRQQKQEQALSNYLDQAKNYCAATGGRGRTPITHAEIDILCIMGDYGGKCEECVEAVRETGQLHPAHDHGLATLHCYEVEWTPEELETHWTNRVIPRYVNYRQIQQLVEEIPGEVWTMMAEGAREGERETTAHELIGLTDHPFDQIIGYAFECERCPILELCNPPHMEALLQVMRAGKRTPDAPYHIEEIGAYAEQLKEMMIPRPRKSKNNAIVEGTQITVFCSGPKPKHEKCPGQGHDDGRWLECQCSCGVHGMKQEELAEEAA